MGSASELDAPLRLTPDQIAHYKRHGFLRIKNAFSAELIERYRAAIEEEVNKAGDTPIDEHLARDRADDSYARAFVQVIKLWLVNPKAREFVFGKRLASAVAQLMEVDGVRVYHDQALFKAPGSGHTPYHADQYYWPLSSEKTVTAWVPLVPVPQEDIRPMEFVAGSHDVDLGRSVGIGMQSMLKSMDPQTLSSMMKANGMPMEPEQAAKMVERMGSVSETHMAWLARMLAAVNLLLDAYQRARAWAMSNAALALALLVLLLALLLRWRGWL